MTRLPMAEVRADLADVVSRVQQGGEPVIIDRHGKPAVAVVPIDMLLRLEASQDAADRKAARRSLREVREKGTISLAELKKQLGL
jgi:prevent-host-death family protein